MILNSIVPCTEFQMKLLHGNTYYEEPLEYESLSLFSLYKP